MAKKSVQIKSPNRSKPSEEALKAFEEGRTAPKRSSSKEPSSSLQSGSSTQDDLIVTTFRITAEQHKALKRAALEQAPPGKRADASAVLRTILANWMT